MIQSIAVFCGSKSGTNPLYLIQAKEIGHGMAERNLHLVYGGGNKGLMGAVANACLAGGGQVTGVIPEILKDKEHSHQQLTKLHVVDGMHIRKKMMYELCDAAIVLPGGYGTMDELFEMITWNQLSIHNKKIILLNSDGYYNSLIAHLDKMFQDGFLYADWKINIVLKETVQDIFDSLNADITD